ncbi:MAG: hypothetical protein M1343_13115 [Chloroflexi bacterium]|nr:hypothetical protein [Chloroflexota bacterium]MDA8188063.1 hypothetical protein [Dehalococcoidales bacterium]
MFDLRSAISHVHACVLGIAYDLGYISGTDARDAVSDVYLEQLKRHMEELNTKVDAVFTIVGRSAKTEEQQEEVELEVVEKLNA